MGHSEKKPLDKFTKMIRGWIKNLYGFCMALCMENCMDVTMDVRPPPLGLLCGVNLYWKTAILNFNLKAYRGLAVPIMLDLEVSFMGGFNLCKIYPLK